MMRLDKFLSNMNIASRSQVKGILKAGRVRVNSKVETKGDAKIDPENDCIEFDGVRVFYELYRYFMLYKPQGCVSATKDTLSDTVLDILKDENTDGLFPVGRLDKDTEGLLLITNDGKLAHELLSPAKHVDKKYYVTLDKAIDDDSIAKIEGGIDIGDDKPCLPCEIEKIESDKVFITIREGRFHQVKRMFAAVGFMVTYLKRISMGVVTLDESLKPGEYRRLTDEEVQSLTNKGE